MILIFDSGIGNIGSIRNMVEIVGGACEIGCSVEQVKRSKKIILPGVGSFDAGMRALKNTGSLGALLEKIGTKDAIVLGICLGMQLLCRRSEEGTEPGLGLVAADVKKLTASAGQKIKVPHMGWNVVQTNDSSEVLMPCAEANRFYFVHSYKVVPDDPTIAIGTTNYGGNFCSAFAYENIFGVQFHPEKSHRFGKNLMSKFVDL